MIDLFGQLRAKIRNLFSIADFQKRYDDGKLQVKTHSGRVIEKKEAFPYGFTAKAKTGKTFVFCQGGDFSSFEIMPLTADDDVCPPELKEGDVALYTQNGGLIVCRDDGGVEIKTGSGDTSIETKEGTILVKEDGNIELIGQVKAKGGSFECSGTASPNGKGCLCAKPFCSWDGSSHIGSKAEGT